MVQHLDYLNETASQTAGPFVHIGLAPHLAGLELEGPQLGSVIATKDTPGDHIAVTGKVIDGAGEAIKDVMIEVWQADADGQYTTDP